MKTQTQRNETISFRVSPKIKDELKRLSDQQGMSMAKFLEFQIHAMLQQTKRSKA